MSCHSPAPYYTVKHTASFQYIRSQLLCVCIRQHIFIKNMLCLTFSCFLHIVFSGAMTMNEFQSYLEQAFKNLEVHPVEQELTVPEYDIFEELRDAICELRDELSLTQKELAELSGLTQSNICKIERGVCHPTIESLKKIADATGRKLSVQFTDFEEVIDHD